MHLPCVFLEGAAENCNGERGALVHDGLTALVHDGPTALGSHRKERPRGGLVPSRSAPPNAVSDASAISGCEYPLIAPACAARCIPLHGALLQYQMIWPTHSPGVSPRVLRLERLHLFETLPRIPALYFSLSRAPAPGAYPLSQGVALSSAILLVHISSIL